MVVQTAVMLVVGVGKGCRQTRPVQSRRDTVLPARSLPGDHSRGITPGIPCRSPPPLRASSCRAIRIGTNHGSLSARTLSYYGDTPRGMVESAFEFAGGRAGGMGLAAMWARLYFVPACSGSSGTRRAAWGGGARPCALLWLSLSLVFVCTLAHCTGSAIRTQTNRCLSHDAPPPPNPHRHLPRPGLPQLPLLHEGIQPTGHGAGISPAVGGGWDG